MTFTDVALARRLEAFEANFAADCACARLELQPDSDTVVLPVAGGFALFLGEKSPISEAKGLGMSGPVSLDELEAMEQLFLDRGVAARITVCPLADPSLLAGLNQRGFRPVGFEDLLYRELGTELDAVEPVPGLVIRRVEPGEVPLLSLVMARGFVAPGEPGPELLEIMELAARTEGQTSLLAWVADQPVAGASLIIRDGLAMLAGASTLPDFRNRGIQKALGWWRLHEARRQGCELIVMGAEPGSSSHRNAERLGFRVAYTKLVMVREPE
jgi:GNAT superfamily N-acetyltransferase